MSTQRSFLFSGVATALITPFSEGKIDYHALGNLMDWQIDCGVDALLLAGTTGEASTLSVQEHYDLISFAAKKINGRVPLLAGCGSNNTAHAISLGRNACDAGADALLAVTPYYNKTTDRGIVLHYQALADSVSKPLILYNVPSRTGFSMTLSHYKELAEHPNILGIKEASGNLSLLESVAVECAEQVAVYTGNDEQMLSALKLGAQGCISVLSNVLPKEAKEIYTAYVSGDSEKAYRLHRLLLTKISALFCEVNPVPVKYAAYLLGLCRTEMRLPLCEPSEESKKRIKKEFLGGAS